MLRAACNHYVETARGTTREATFCCGAWVGLFADDLIDLRSRGAAPRVEAFRAAEVTHLAAICAICKSQFARVFPEYAFDREQVISVHHLVGDAVRLDPRPWPPFSAPHLSPVGFAPSDGTLDGLSSREEATFPSAADTSATTRRAAEKCCRKLTVLSAGFLAAQFSLTSKSVHG